MWEFATNMSEVLGGLLLLTWAVSGYRAGRLVFRPSRLVLDSTFLQGRYYEVSGRQVLSSAVAPSRVEWPLRPWSARERDVKPWSARVRPAMLASTSTTTSFAVSATVLDTSMSPRSKRPPTEEAR